MKSIRMFGTAVAVLLVGGAAPLLAQRGRDDRPTTPVRQPPPQRVEVPRAQPQRTQQPQRVTARQQPQRPAPRTQQAPARPIQQSPRVDVHEVRQPVHTQPQQMQRVAPRTQEPNLRQAQRVEQRQVAPQRVQIPPRVTQPNQSLRAAEAQQRMNQYERTLHGQLALAQQREALLQQQHRLAQYRFQQQYLLQLREQQLRLQALDYSRDPYFFTAPSYRYNLGGTYYETNQYGVNLLRQAVGYGYQEGYEAGQADRQDGWPANYQNSYAYQDANFGYAGDLEPGTYNYYFRQGFSRGYDDGYYGRSQYGNYLNGNYSMFGNVLSGILGLEPIVP